ncbi:MAG: HRDC domain-containing protein [Firmicutes bacterium]|nr:HRDC domain-containing protein [Bacillota bacterium]
MRGGRKGLPLPLRGGWDHMDLEFTISAREAGTALQVEIAGDRATLGLATGRKIVFEGCFGDIRVKVLPAVETAPEVTAEEAMEQATAQATEQAAPQEITAEQSEQLFRRLVALRKQLSSEVKLPPYIIFHDSTLKEMCRRLPADLETLGQISGVGESKLTKYGARFLEAIQGFLKGQGKEG